MLNRSKSLCRGTSGSLGLECAIMVIDRRGGWPMSRQQKDPLRSLQAMEQVSLARLSRSASAPAAQVARARALLAVAEGLSYAAAAHLVGRRTGDTVARWVAGFNRGGLAAVGPRHGGGQPLRYGAVEQRRILAEVARPLGR